MRFAAFALFCLLGCDGSEVGNPPFQPEVPGPAFEPSAFEEVPHPAGAGQNILRIPASAVPGVVRMTVTFLGEANSARAMTRVGGVFEANVDARAGERRVRIEGRTNTTRIEPMDFDIGLEEVRFHDPVDGCIELETRSVIADGNVSVRARNRCDEAITVHGALRVGDWFAEPSTQMVAPDEVVSFELIPADLADSDTLLLTADSQTVAITLWR